MPLSGLLSDATSLGGWPSIFYVFGIVGTIWCVAFLFMVYEDPESHPTISEDEKKYILSSLWGNAGSSVTKCLCNHLIKNLAILLLRPLLMASYEHQNFQSYSCKMKNMEYHFELLTDRQKEFIYSLVEHQAAA